VKSPYFLVRPRADMRDSDIDLSYLAKEV
jgi:hypothetical protein